MKKIDALLVCTVASKGLAGLYYVMRQCSCQFWPGLRMRTLVYAYGRGVLPVSSFIVRVLVWVVVDLF
jgi:hypothetical protein